MALERLDMMIRMPSGLKKALTVHASANMRSLNSEMLARLAQSLNGNGKAPDPRQLSLGFGAGSERTKHKPRPRQVNRTKHAARARKPGRTNRRGVKRG